MFLYACNKSIHNLCGYLNKILTKPTISKPDSTQTRHIDTLKVINKT